jgi:hypothetical protein
MLPGSRRFGDLRRDGLGALGAAVDADVKHRDKKAAINGSDVTNPKNSPALFASGTAAVVAVIVKEGGLSIRSKRSKGTPRYASGVAMERTGS